MGSSIEYLSQLEAEATDYAVRVQIACAGAIIEAIREASSEEQSTLHLLVTGEAGGTIRFGSTPAPSFAHWSGAATKPDNAGCPACKGAGYYGLDDDTVICKCRATSDATAAWEAHKKAYEIVRAEMDDVHRTLTHCGVPEQIPPFKAALAPAKARVLYLSARCNQLFDEAADTQERLDQFEAYDITVKSALDDRARAARYEEALREANRFLRQFHGSVNLASVMQLTEKIDAALAGGQPCLK